jgi:serine/threonine-protein kinase
VAAVLAAAGTWLLLGSKGDLLVSVSGPANAAVSGVKIFVNGEQKCSQSPCQVTGLRPGPYTVRAEAPGFAPSAGQAVKVESGGSAVANIQMRAESIQPQLTVSATGAGLRVLVDGKDRGTAPLELSGLASGPHTIRVEGPGFEAIEQTVTITEGAPLSVGPLSPKLIKGSLRIELGNNAEGAQVLINGKGVRSLPATLELDAAERHEVLVRKVGFADYQRQVSFSAAEPKVDLTINLEEGSSDLGSGRASGAARSPNDAPEPPAETPAAVDDKKPDFLEAIKGGKESTAAKPTEKANEKPVATGKGTLNINSVPPTTVLLDGRPLGKTPKVGVSVSAGSHSITFVHPDKGRKSVKVDVPSGGSKNVTIRL